MVVGRISSSDTAPKPSSLFYRIFFRTPGGSKRVELSLTARTGGGAWGGAPVETPQVVATHEDLPFPTGAQSNPKLLYPWEGDISRVAHGDIKHLPSMHPN